MPQIDINFKRGSSDAKKNLVDFWEEKNPILNENNILIPLNLTEENRWGFKPDPENDIIIPIGKDEKGYTLFDFNQGYHLIAGGSMLSGAGMFKRVSLLHLLKTYSSEKVKIALIDTTNQMEGFDKSKHLLFPRATKREEIIKILNLCREESDRRMDFLIKRDKERSILKYHKYKDDQEEVFPDIFIFISELGDVISEESNLSSIIRIVQISRVTNMHFIITTQRPGPEVMPTLIQANFFNRIAFQMPYKEESELFITKAGAEELLGQGDMLFMDSYNNKIHHLQGLYFLEDDIKEKVDGLNSLTR